MHSCSVSSVTRSGWGRQGGGAAGPAEVVGRLRAKAGPANRSRKNRREERESWGAVDLAQTT
jgi:hypothetical protein